MSTNSQLEAEAMVYQETIKKLYSQSTSLSGTNAGRWKPHTRKWLIHHDSVRDYRITDIMKGIWKRTRDSGFFANLNVPKAVLLEVDTFIGTHHPWKSTGANKDYEKSPGFKQWKRKKNTTSVLCAIIRMVPFNTRIPQGMHWAEDVVLRDTVAMANGFKPRRKYPSRFMEKRQETGNNERSRSDAETQPIPQPNRVLTQLVETTTRLDMSEDSDMTLDVVSHHDTEGVAYHAGSGRATERPREPQAGSSNREPPRKNSDGLACGQRTPGTASKPPTLPPNEIQTNTETERRQYKKTVRSILTAEEPAFDIDTETWLAESESDDPNRLVANLREEIKTQVAAAVRQEKLTAERATTLEGVVSALEREDAAYKTTILALQAAASETRSAIPACVQARTVRQRDAATQTLPERMGITDEEIKAIIDNAVATFEQENQE